MRDGNMILVVTLSPDVHVPGTAFAEHAAKEHRSRTIYWLRQGVMELASGTVIGARFRLDRLLGVGGMGTVWAAEDTVTGRRCALKLMKDAADPEARRRFLREGRAASAVRHPSVVSILDVLEPENGPPAIAMELLEGESLRARLARERKLPLAALAEIAVGVVSAVGAAHALGIVHRDLKPENIFLCRGTAGEIVKVLDFGIAKLTALDGEAIRSTGITTGAVLGTPAYMAPEQVFAENDLDHRADVWALGVILYECLSGICPTAGGNVGQVLKHVVARPFEPLSQVVPDVPGPVSRLVARMLERERERRPYDLGEVLEVLAPFATGHVGARPRAERSSATSFARPRTRHLELRTGRGRVWLRISAVIVLGIAAARWCWPSPPSPPSPSSGSPPSCPADMVPIPAGTFEMGSPSREGEADEHPQHEVTLSAYCIDKQEVTVAAYDDCVKAGSCSPATRTVTGSRRSEDQAKTRSRYCNGPDRPGHPINCVDWYEAATYCRSQHKRLPTEAEWEYAARGSDGRGYPWGNEPPSAARVNACGPECVELGERELKRHWTATYDEDDGAASTAPVGHYPAGASPFGVLDMAGNVNEWTADRYGPYSAAAATDPPGAQTGQWRVFRGGGWGVGWNGKKAAVLRGKGSAMLRDMFVGFRCARGG